MTSAQIRSITFDSFKDFKIIFWYVIRVLSSFSPLILTYIFAQGIAAIEEGRPLDATINIFVIYLVLEVGEHFFRVGSKTRISAYTEGKLLEIQEELASDFPEKTEHRSELVQSFRNYTKAIRDFTVYLYNYGVQGIVSFASIPVILFFIDKKVFVFEIALIAIYLIVTWFRVSIYEKRFEKFDKSREYYFSALHKKNNVDEEAGYIRKNILAVQNTVLVNWVSLQTLISIFNFLIIFFVVKDVVGGSKQISDLVLIAGYAKESKMFLNHVTGTMQRYMEVKAGAERVIAVTKKESLSTFKED